MSFRYPIDEVRITQGFGESPDYYKQFGQIGHNGIDIGCNIGTPVYASESGTIYYEGWGNNHSWMGSIAGICIIIDHSSVYTGYAHLSSTIVNKGQSVTKGQLIGYSGSTGTSTGGHVHFEFIGKPPNFSNGYAGRLNPNIYLNKGVVMDTNDGIEVYRTALLREPENQSVAGQWNGLKPSTALATLRSQKEWQDLNYRVKNYDAVSKKLADTTTNLNLTKTSIDKLNKEKTDLTAKANDLNMQINDLKSTTLDLSNKNTELSNANTELAKQLDELKNKLSADDIAKDTNSKVTETLKWVKSLWGLLLNLFKRSK